MLTAIVCGMMMIAQAQPDTSPAAQDQAERADKEYLQRLDQALETGLRCLAEQQNAAGSSRPRLQSQKIAKKTKNKEKKQW